MDEDELWRLTLARADGGRMFVYAVTSTGIFCRPTCPSRRPLRKNTRFYDSPASAELAGFRSCLRCRPAETVSGSTRASPPPVEAALAALGQAQGPVSARHLAAAAGVSPRQLQRLFVSALGVSPRVYGEALRADAARTALSGSTTTVSDAAFSAGYGSMRGFYDAVGPRLGLAPATYAAGGAGEQLLWTVAEHALGTLLVVVSRRGVVAARIGRRGSDGADALAEVAAELPRATLIRDDVALADVASHIAGLASGADDGQELPLDVRGTAFQAAVWAQLRTIPAGETRSYGQVARSIGRPTAVRAVAGACASNPVALVVPCHRVLRGDGGLGGFRWGLAVKRALLRAEQEPVDARGTR